jgi:iron complex outermembrane receptor protein
MKNKSLLFVCLYLFANNLIAQDKNVSDSINQETLTTVSVYAFKSKQIKNIQKLTNSDWIKHDAGDVLSQVPGFSSIKKSGSYGFDPMFRGFKWEQINILNDGGLTAHAACPNRMDPPASQVMINQVDRIEIFKGPHNFRYGPSTGAIINLKINSPEFVNKTELTGRMTIGGETNGSVFRTEGVVGIKSKKVNLSLAESFSIGSDYKDGNDSIIPAEFNRNAINLNASFLIKENHILSVNVTKNRTKNTDFPTLMMDLLSDDTWMLQGKYNIASTNNWYNQWNTQVFTSMVDHQMGNALRPISASMFSNVFSNTQTSGGRTEFVINKNNTNIYFSGDLKYEYANGNRTRKMITGMMAGKTFIDTLWQKSSVTRAGLFFHADRRIGKVDFNISTRLDRVESKPAEPAYRFSNFYKNLNSVDVNPSISVGATSEIANNFHAGIWLGSGIRSASITERFINFLPVGLDAYEVIGNPELNHEINRQVDVILQLKKEKLNAYVNLFASSVENFISSVVLPGVKPVVSTSPGVRQFINIPEARLYGFEFSWLQKITHYLKNNLSTTYTYGQDMKLNQPLPEISPLEFRNRLDQVVVDGKLSVYANMRYVANQDRISTVFNEKKTKDFTLFDLGLKYFPTKRSQISFDVTNVFDVTYREHLSRFISFTKPLNSLGRNFILIYTYQF